MRVYVVYCHPNEDSFTNALFERARATLTDAGHDVRTSDLYADGFEPTLSAVEWRDHPRNTPPTRDVVAYCENLQWCEALVLVYPTWWGGLPAMLSGWLDRVLEWRGI